MPGLHWTLDCRETHEMHHFQGFRTSQLSQMLKSSRLGQLETPPKDVTKQGCASTVSGECRAGSRSVIRTIEAQTGILQLLFAACL